MAPPDLEAWNANLVGGDLGGGSNAWHRQLVFRPLFPVLQLPDAGGGPLPLLQLRPPGRGRARDVRRQRRADPRRAMRIGVA